MKCDCSKKGCGDIFGFRGFTKENFKVNTAQLAFKVIFALYWICAWTFRICWYYYIGNVKHTRLNRTEDGSVEVIPFPNDDWPPKEYSDHLTNWGDTLCLINFTLSAIAVIINRTKNPKLDASHFDRTVLLFHEASSTIGLIITVLYYALLTPNWSFVSLHSHMINGIFLAIDIIFLVKFPLRAGHVIYPLITAFLFALGNYIAFRINPERNQVYDFIDWNQPFNKEDGGLGTLSIIALVIFVATPAFFYILFGITKLRDYIYTKLPMSEISETPIDVEVDQTQN